METLQIQSNDTLSINELTALQRRGFSVMRSAHVGNLSPYNLALADAGIPLLLVDHNVTGVDKNYFPELMLTQTGQVRVAEDGTIASRTITQNGQFLDELHIAGIADALPDADVFTNTEYLQQNELVAGEITRLAVQYFPDEFERVVQSDGTTVKMGSAADVAKRIGILQLREDPRIERAAVLMPNMVNIMSNFVIEALQSERDVQYHISGPDMVLYMKDLQRVDKFKEFYEIIKREAPFGIRLPDQLTVDLVPATSARFATSAKWQPELSSLFSRLDESTVAIAALAAERKAFFASNARNDMELKRSFETASNQRSSAVERAIVEQAEQVPGLFVAPKREIGFITQYDVLQDGGLFVSPQNTERSFSELAALTKRLATLRKRIGP